MGFIIRDAKKSDVKSILKLIKELAIFEREPNEVILTEQQLIIDGFQFSAPTSFKLTRVPCLLEF